MGLAFPLGLAAGLLAIPLVLLYVLKLRRRDVEVSSTLLWRRVVEDRRANAPWERLRRHLLLLLQLIVLALLVLAFAGPYMRAETALRGDTVVVLDASASMGAASSPGASTTRFDAAIGIVERSFLAVAPDRRAALVLAGPEPRVVAPLAAERAILRDALRSARVAEAPADLAGALELASTLVRGSAGGEVLLVTDGAFDRTPAIARQLERVRWILVGEGAAPNAAIASLALRPAAGEPGVHELFAGLLARGAPASVDLVVEAAIPPEGAAGEAPRPEGWSWSAVARESARVEAGEEGARLLRVEAAPGTVLRVSMKSASGDALRLDDSAFLVVPPRAARRVLLVSPRPFLLERALSAQPGLDVFVIDESPGRATGYDAVVIDGPLPELLPAAPLLAFGRPAAIPGSAPARVESPRIVRWDARHPALRHARFDAVQVDAAWSAPLPPGGSVLVEGDFGPLAVTWPAPGGRALSFRFDLVDTDLPLRVAFPVLVADALDWLTSSDSSGALRTGRAVDLPMPGSSDGDVVELLQAAGPARRLEVRSGSLRLPPLERQGVHALVAEGSRQLVAAALLSPEESDLASRGLEGLPPRDEDPVAAAESGRRPLWPLAAALAMGVLLAEWGVHHRRRE